MQFEMVRAAFELVDEWNTYFVENYQYNGVLYLEVWWDSNVVVVVSEDTGVLAVFDWGLVDVEGLEKINLYCWALENRLKKH